MYGIAVNGPISGDTYGIYSNSGVTANSGIGIGISVNGPISGGEYGIYASSSVTANSDVYGIYL